MKKLFSLFAILLLTATSAMAQYEQGDYIYSRTAKYKITSNNYIENWWEYLTTIGGTTWPTDTIVLYQSSDALYGENALPDGEPIVMVYGENIQVGIESASDMVTKPTSKFEIIVPVEANKRYISSYKVKGSEEWHSACGIRGYYSRNCNSQTVEFYDTPEPSISPVTVMTEWFCYSSTDGWVERNYELVTEQDGFIVFRFFNLLKGDCFGDFGVYEVSPVADDRAISAFVDELKTYTEYILPEYDTDESYARQEIVEGILPMFEEYLDEEELIYDEISGQINAIAQQELVDFLDASTIDLSNYYTNLKFDGLSTGSTRVASGWTAEDGTNRWGLEGATGEEENGFDYIDAFQTVHLYNYIASNYTLSEGRYSQTANLPGGTYIIAIKAQAFSYFCNGSGSSSDFTIPDYSTKVEGIKFFFTSGEKSDTIELDVPADKAKTFILKFDAPEDGDKTIGFYSPGCESTGWTSSSGNTTGGGNHRFDILQFRLAGPTTDINDYGVKVSVDENRATLLALISTATAAYGSNKYVFGKDDLKETYENAQSIYDNNTQYTEECLANLEDGVSALTTAWDNFTALNAEYTTLVDDVESANEYYNDENRPNGKEDLFSAISTAQSYLDAVDASSRDSLGLVQTDSVLLVVLNEYLLANASPLTPAELIGAITNNTFQLLSDEGWEQDGTSGNAIWKYHTDEYFSEGYCAYYNRGYSASDEKYLWQDVEIPYAGAYKFVAEMVCRNYTSGSSEFDTTFQCIFIGSDSLLVYTPIGEGITINDNQQWPGGNQKFGVVTIVEDITEANGKVRIGTCPTIVDTLRTYHPNLIYFGSTHIYYLGSEETYLNGITDVQKEEAKKSTGYIYSISGALVRKSNTLEGLPKGIYIREGKKYIVK